jgi:hypothetical protein
VLLQSTDEAVVTTPATGRLESQSRFWSKHQEPLGPCHAASTPSKSIGFPRLDNGPAGVATTGVTLSAHRIYLIRVTNGKMTRGNFLLEAPAGALRGNFVA